MKSGFMRGPYGDEKKQVGKEGLEFYGEETDNGRERVSYRVSKTVHVAPACFADKS